jgi:two-component system phosphate regulon sensor histidine kinase PhoR
MKKGIFRKTFAAYALIMVLSIIFTEIYITAAVRQNYINNLRKNLAVQTDLAVPLIDFNGDDIGELCRTLKERTGARITVIGKDGAVLGDSDESPARMENHLARPEIQESLTDVTGSAIRYSETLKHDFLYFSRKVAEEERLIGFVRMAVPLEEIGSAVNILRIKIVLVVSMVLLATGIFSLLRTNQLRKLLGQITDFSKALARGDLETRLFLEEAEEFDEIAKNLNSMSGRFRNMIDENEEETKRLSVILKSIPDALLIVDSGGAVVLASSSAKEFFRDVTLLGQRYIEIVRNQEFAELMDRVRRDHSPGMAKIRLDRPDERYLMVRVSPLFYRGVTLSGFVVVFHDITQIEKLERMRKDFVVNVSHEIKTPVTAIRGFADTLLDGAIDDRDNAVKFLQTIRANSERINSLVDDLMMISRIELGVIRIEKSEVDFGDVAGHVLETLGEKASAKNLYLKTSVKSEMKTILADKNRLLQILINLVDNAIKFTETGGIILGMEEEEGKPVLFVEDTGMGIPGEHLPRLGERFYRVDAARSRKMGGTGLGLAIVKHLVKAHGWEMLIESSPGKGTRVKIFITAV